MDKTVHTLVVYLFTLILFVHSQESSINESVKRRKQDFYCSGIEKTQLIDNSL